jgi:TolB protein
MICKEAEAKLEALVDDQLSSAEREAITAHIASCQTCRRRLALAQRLAGELRPTLHSALGMAKPAPELKEQLRGRLWRSPGRMYHLQTMPLGLRWRWLLHSVGTVAGLVVLVALAIALRQVLRQRDTFTTAGLPAVTVTPGWPVPQATGSGGMATPAATTGPTIATPATARPTGGPTLAMPATARPTAGPATLAPTVAPVTVTPYQPGATGKPSPLPRPSVSPVSQKRAEMTGKLVFRTSNGGGIYLLNVECASPTEAQAERCGTSPKYLTDGMDPALSPDGSMVAFARWREPRGLYIIKSDGSEERLVFGVPQARAPTWSPTGARLAFSLQSGHKPAEKECEWRKDGDTGKLKEVCTINPEDWFWTIATFNINDGSYRDMPSALHSFSPAWSPDGRRIVYQAERGLVSVDLDDPSGTLIGLTLDTGDRSPAWSPDGTSLVLAHKQDNAWEINLVANDGSARQRMTSAAPASDISPAWSPDGKYIAFISNRRGNWEIWTMLADGSEQRPLFAGGMPVPILVAGADDRVISWGP